MCFRFDLGNDEVGSSILPSSTRIRLVFKQFSMKDKEAMIPSSQKLAAICGSFAAIVVQFAYNPQLRAAPPPPPITISCDAIAVWDGDGPIICADGRKIRLAGIAAREMEGTCRPGHPCPPRSGVASRDRLVQLLGGARGRWKKEHVAVRATLRCDVTGFNYGRVTAFCRTATGIDLNCEMLKGGYAKIWPKHWLGHRCPN